MHGAVVVAEVRIGAGSVGGKVERGTVEDILVGEGCGLVGERWDDMEAVGVCE